MTAPITLKFAGEEPIVIDFDAEGELKDRDMAVLLISAMMLKLNVPRFTFSVNDLLKVCGRTITITERDDHSAEYEIV